MKQKNDQKKTKKVEKIDRSLLSGKSQKSEADRRVDLGIRCTLNQFLTFANGVSEARKSRIVRGQLPKKDAESGKFPVWYTRAKSPILHALRRKDISPVVQKISELKRHKINPDKRNEGADIRGSIKALEDFLKMQMPVPFSLLIPEKVKLKEKNVVKHGVRLKITPDFVFEGKLNGMPVFGAVKILLRKGDVLHERQGTLGAHLLHEYMESQKEKFEGEVRPDLCLFIDVFRQRVFTAQPVSEAPKRHLRESCSEFTEIWRALEKGE